MKLVGLTGSIGMGKSTVLRMFDDLDVPTQDADQLVHEMYKPGGDLVQPILNIFPHVKAEDGGIDRQALAKIAFDKHDRHRLRLEEMTRPLIAKRQQSFVTFHERANTPMAVMEVPLLFERSMDQLFHTVLVVSAPAEVQKARAMARPFMTEEKFAKILDLQIPDEEKRRRANDIIDTGTTLEYTWTQVKQFHKRMVS